MLFFTFLLGSRSMALDFQVHHDIGRVYEITLWGEINGFDGIRFEDFVLEQLRAGRLIGNVNIYSQGGDVDSAMRIGEEIRLLDASTQAPNAPITINGKPECYFGNFESRQKVEGGSCRCASACFIVWAGGVGRAGSYIGVHTFKFEKDFYKGLSMKEARKLYEAAMVREQQYFQRMGVPESVVNNSFLVGSDSLRYLEHTELQSMRNPPAYVGEMITARCPKYTAGEDAPYDPNDPYSICVQKVTEERLTDAANEFLAAKGKAGEKFPDVTVPLPAPTPPAPTVPPVVAPAPSAPTTTSVSYQRYDNRDIYSNDVGVFRDVDQANCESACTSNSQCEAYSYNKWKRVCFLKSGLRASRLEPSSISVVKNSLAFPPVVDVQATVSIYRNRSFSGEGIGDMAMASTEACANVCSTRLSCVAYNFYNTQKICRFFNSQSALPVASAGIDSGSKSQAYVKE
jgi:hypothetical protein